MNWLVFGVQWLHVILAVLWFGSVLYADFVLVPALNTLPLTTQRTVGAALGVRANRIIPPVAGLVILLGVVRGTVLGPIKSLGDLTTAYGLTWLVALVLAAATFVYGLRVIAKSLERLSAIPDSEALNPDGSASPKLTQLIAEIKRHVLLELVLFLAIFTCMILMRFNL